MFVKEMVIKYV